MGRHHANVVCAARPPPSRLSERSAAARESSALLRAGRACGTSPGAARAQARNSLIRARPISPALSSGGDVNQLSTHEDGRTTVAHTPVVDGVPPWGFAAPVARPRRRGASDGETRRFCTSLCTIRARQRRARDRGSSVPAAILRGARTHRSRPFFAPRGTCGTASRTFLTQRQLYANDREGHGLFRDRDSAEGVSSVSAAGTTPATSTSRCPVNAPAALLGAGETLTWQQAAEGAGVGGAIGEQ